MMANHQPWQRHEWQLNLHLGPQESVRNKIHLKSCVLRYYKFILHERFLLLWHASNCIFLWENLQHFHGRVSNFPHLLHDQNCDPWIKMINFMFKRPVSLVIGVRSEISTTNEQRRRRSAQKNANILIWSISLISSSSQLIKGHKFKIKVLEMVTQNCC